MQPYEGSLRLYSCKQTKRHAYTCVTSDLANRVSLHKQGLIEGFTKRYKVHMLVYYETHHLMPDAIRREKQ